VPLLTLALDSRQVIKPHQGPIYSPPREITPMPIAIPQSQSGKGVEKSKYASPNTGSNPEPSRL
jgi:hypothetical protein